MGVAADTQPINEEVVMVVEQQPHEEDGCCADERAHFWPACLAAYCCHAAGLAATMAFFNTKTGRTGAFTGLSVAALKAALCALLAAVVAAHVADIDEFHPAMVVSHEMCDMKGGMWAPRLKPLEIPTAHMGLMGHSETQQQQQQDERGAEVMQSAEEHHGHHGHHGHHAHHGSHHGFFSHHNGVSEGTFATHYCACPCLSITRVEDGAVVCSSAVVPLAVFSGVFFVIFLALASMLSYIKNQPDAPPALVVAQPTYQHI